MKLWTKIEQAFKSKGMHLLESMLAKKVFTPSDIDWNSIETILVIRQHDQLGDFLLSTPVFRALRERWPRALIAVMVRSYTEPVIRHNQYVDDVIVLEEVGYHWTMEKLKTFWRKLRRGYDLTIVINTVSHSLSSDLLAWLSHASYILGPSHLTFSGTSRNFFYNLIAPYQDNHRHQSEKNLDIVRYIGADTKNLREHITILPDEKKQAKAIFRKLGFHLDHPIIGIHPGAGKRENRWPVSRFAELSNRCTETLQAQILLFYGPNEEDLRDRFLTRISIPAYFEKDLQRLLSVLSVLDLFIGNDTGTTHMAAATGTPVVVIFGPTPANEWKPWGDEFVSIQGEYGKCDRVTVDDVFTRAKKLLGRFDKDKF